MSGSAAGVYVPGLRAALIDYWRQLDTRWTGQHFGDYAEAAERGESIIVGYPAIFCAAFAAGIDNRIRDLDPGSRYALSGDDVLVPAGAL